MYRTPRLVRARTALLAALLFFLAAAAARAGEAQKPIGFAQKVVKNVSALENDKYRRMLDRLSPVFLADFVETSRASTAQFEFWDGTILAMTPESRIELAQFVYDPDNETAGQLLFRLGSGLFRAVAGRIAHNASTELAAMRLEAPLGSIGVRGTDLIVEVGASNMSVSVLEGGPVEFTEPSGATTQIRAGMRLSMRTGGRPDLGRLSPDALAALDKTLSIDLDAAKAAATAILGAAKTRVPEDPFQALQAVRDAYARTADKSASTDRRGLDREIRGSLDAARSGASGGRGDRGSRGGERGGSGEGGGRR